jgi:hypothetical protein
MPRYTEALLGDSNAAREDATGKVPADMEILLQEKCMVYGSLRRETKLPIELLDLVREAIEAGDWDTSITM